MNRNLGNIQCFGHYAYSEEEKHTIGEELQKECHYEQESKGDNADELIMKQYTHCVEEANRIFGFNGWSSEIRNFSINQTEKNSKLTSVSVSFHLRISLKDGSFREEIEFYSCSDPSAGNAIAYAYKMAFFLSFLRCFSAFGRIFRIEKSSQPSDINLLSDTTLQCNDSQNCQHFEPSTIVPHTHNNADMKTPITPPNSRQIADNNMNGNILERGDEIVETREICSSLEDLSPSLIMEMEKISAVQRQGENLSKVLPRLPSSPIKQSSPHRSVVQSPTRSEQMQHAINYKKLLSSPLRQQSNGKIEKSPRIAVVSLDPGAASRRSGESVTNTLQSSALIDMENVPEVSRLPQQGSDAVYQPVLARRYT